MATTQLITNNYKLHMAQQFINSFTGPSNTIYYAFAAQGAPWPGGVAPPLYDTNQTVQFDTYNNMLFGKHITPNDVSLMVNAYLWTSGTVYSMYDNTDVNLSTKQFYVYVYQAGTYYVFKCLYNNKGSQSIYPPTFADSGAADIFYQTADGYQWKYMYQIDAGTFSKFATSLYIPVLVDNNVTANAVSGAVDVIAVSTSGSGYNNYFSGKFNSSAVFTTQGQNYVVQLSNVVYSNSTTTVYASPNNVIIPSTITGVYNQCYLYITGGTGKGEYQIITSHVSNTSGIFLYLAAPFTITPDATSYFDISPNVIILNAGDDNITTSARALINSASSNSVASVQVLNRGSNVRAATAFVYASPQVGVTGAATLQVIGGPKGGHGSNVAAELYSSRVGVSVTFSNSEVGTIPTVGSYSSAGILKDPLFSNVVFTISGVNGTFVNLETISQVTVDSMSGLNQTSTAVVTQVNLGTLQVSNVNGIFVVGNSTYGTIVGQTSQANAVVTAILNNSVVKQFETFTQYYTYQGSMTSGMFQTGESVYQNVTNIDYSSNYEISTGVFFANSSSGGNVYITSKYGPIYPLSLVSGLLIGNTSGAKFDINIVTAPDLVPESGDVIYIENFDQVNRSSTQSETIKLILEY